MSLEEVWNGLVAEIPTTVGVVLHLSKIESYLANPSFYAKHKNAGKGREYLFLSDLLFYTSTGNQVRMMLAPTNKSIAVGRLLEGNLIIATSITKTKATGSDHLYLVLNDWKAHPEPGKFQLRFENGRPLPGYMPAETLLGNQTGNTLCRWTLSSLLENQEPPLQRFASLRSKGIPGHLQQALRALNPDMHNLKYLDRNWTSLKSPLPLVLRVLAKSKSRIIIRQADHRKPILALTTILVGDRTGYCKLLVWDEAVVFFSRILEGDIIVLGGRYKVGRYHPAKPEAYFLEPKIRSGLAPTTIEIKINHWDLEAICILDHAVSMTSLLPPTWNFQSIHNIIQGKAGGGNLIDVTGVIIHHGRWEREGCRNENKSPTGQYWIRVWLRVVDQSCFELQPSIDPTTGGVGVKLYVDRERWEGVEGLLPGRPAVITNLLYKQCQDEFSFLECTNETQVFPGDLALSSRFNNPGSSVSPPVTVSNSAVETFRDSWNNNQNWSTFIRRNGVFGGSLLPSPAQHIQFTQGHIFENNKTSLELLLKELHYKSSARILFVAKLWKVQILSIGVDNTGRPNLADNNSVQTTLEDEFIVDDGESFNPDGVYFAPVPSTQSFVRKIGGLGERELGEEVSSLCFLDTEASWKPPKQTTKGNDKVEVCMLALKLEDCGLWCQAEMKDQAEFRMLEESSRFCVDFFRFSAHDQSDPSKGVEAVLRRFATIQPAHKDGQLVDPAPLDLNQATDQTANQTRDILEPFD